MRKTTTQAKVTEVTNNQISLEDKIKDMLFRMYCSCDDEALSMETDPTSIVTQEGVLPGLSCSVKLNGVRELSEENIYTFLEEDSLINKSMVVDEYGNITLKFDTNILE